MNEKIILAPHCAGTELVRSMAKYGISTIGYRVMNSVQLADCMMTKSGKLLGKTPLSFREQVAFIRSYILGSDIPYLKNSSYADAENIASAINIIRSCITENPEENVKDTILSGEFDAKNKAVFAVYKAYEKYLGDDLADADVIIRTAIERCKDLSLDISLLKEFPCTPIEKLLAETAAGGKCSEISIKELFGVKSSDDINEETNAVSSFTRAYGASNEVEDIIGQIYSEKLPLDKCVAAVTNSSKYAQLFYDASERFNIPMTFGCGVPVTNTNPGRLLKAMHYWATDGQYGLDALKAVLNNPAFKKTGIIKEFLNDSDDKKEAVKMYNRAVEIAGNLLVMNNPQESVRRLEEYRSSLPEQFPDQKDARGNDREIIDKLAGLITEAGIGWVSTIKRYCVIRDGEMGALDIAASNLICAVLESVEGYDQNREKEMMNIIPQLLKKHVHSESSREGYLHICSLEEAMSTVREHLFVAGLSADIYPGRIKENYLLLDSDMKNLEDAPTTEKLYRDKIRKFNDLLSLYTALNTDIRISYSYFDPASLKDMNMSSVIYELSKGRDFREAQFFKHSLTPAAEVGRHYVAGENANARQVSDKSPAVEFALDKGFSPSAIDEYLSCPRQYYLDKVLKIPQPDPDDPNEAMNARDFGNAGHHVLEAIYPGMPEEELMKTAENEIDSFFKFRPPLSHVDAERRKQEFLEVMKHGFEMDPGNENAEEYSEHDVEGVHPSGIKIHGYPDRIERLDNGRYIVVDYKTGNSVGQKDEDPVSCKQALIYAYLLEQNYGIEIERVEYRYPKADRVVVCHYTDEVKAGLDELLTGFAKSLERGEYMPIGKCEEQSKYCKYGPICAGFCIEGKQND